MIDDINLDDLRRIPRVSYYFRYPLRPDDFHELEIEYKLRGHYASKPLYSRLKATREVDRSAGYNGDIAALFLPLAAGTAAEAIVAITHISPSEVIKADGHRNWPAIRKAAEVRLREILHVPR